MTARLAIDGGPPVRRERLPYGRQSIDDSDRAAVLRVLASDWLTTGPEVAAFERELAAAVGAREAVVVSSGTAALHAIAFALGVGSGDEVVVPALTFCATANAFVYQGATPVFADVDAATLLVDPGDVERRIGPRTRAIVAVDYAGQPCDYEALGALAARRGVPLVADACHALGAKHGGRSAGSLARLTAFSFHPVKHATTAEGGAVTTDDAELAARMRRFRNHGIGTDHRQREELGAWSYEMVDLGYNYRLSDLQCALGRSQLARLPRWLERRRAIAARYASALERTPALRPLALRPGSEHAWHLYVVQVDGERLAASRDRVFAALRAEGIGVNVHYAPVHLHPFYRQRFGTGPGLCPVAESASARLLTLPLFPAMSDRDVDDVIAAVEKVSRAWGRG